MTSTPGEYVQVINPKGYVSNREITNLPGQYLIRGSQNCRIKNGEKVVTKPGYVLLGAEHTMTKGIHSSFDWPTSSGLRRSVRGYFKRLEVWYGDEWLTIKNDLDGGRFEFATWWDSTELIDVLLGVNGTDSVFEWSGLITELASVTATTMTKKGYLSGTGIEFHDNGASADTITDSANGFVTAGFVAGDEIVIEGSATNDGVYTIATVAAGTLTLIPDDELETEAMGPSIVVKYLNVGTWAEARALTAGTRAVVVDGVEYTYTGGENTGTLTGLVRSPVDDGVVAGDIALQALTEHVVSDLSGLSVDRILTMYNHVFFGSTKSRVVEVSKSSDFTDTDFSTPRAPGEGMQLTLDNACTGFAPDEDVLYISAGEDDWYKVDFELSADQAGEAINITKLKTAPGQAARSQSSIFNIKNNIAFLSFEKTIDTLGRIENIDTAESVPISDDIADDMAVYDITGAHGLYFDRNLWITLPAEGVYLIYDVKNKYWQPPQLGSFSRFSIIEVEDELRLCAHSANSNETYLMEEGYNDNGAPFRWVMHFGYENYGTRFAGKNFDETAKEGYISQSTIATHRILYDYKGATDYRDFEIDGSDDSVLFSPNDSAGLGLDPYGANPFGSAVDELDGMSKFRQLDQTTALDFYERAHMFFGESIDSRFELIAYGENVELSDNLPVFIKH